MHAHSSLQPDSFEIPERAGSHGDILHNDISKASAGYLVANASNLPPPSSHLTKFLCRVPHIQERQQYGNGDNLSRHSAARLMHTFPPKGGLHYTALHCNGPDWTMALTPDPWKSFLAISAPFPRHYRSTSPSSSSRYRPSARRWRPPRTTTIRPYRRVVVWVLPRDP